MRRFPIDQIIATSWEKHADDLAIELEICSGEKRHTIEEMRLLLAVKGYRAIPCYSEGDAISSEEPAMSI
ncbi:MULTISPECIES: hypothetical protein [unclassified Bradyrhizobium]|uniref:hypothetical protein n=1 Tax=unclassified Bradyrhizobium TaxID=2631580 RepID=UPI00247A6596|nr:MULTISPECIES: hypothetical protein [unclassified Bradyrhizobium]WGS21741.1 hypothetical protein MTX22_08605 [Bradyrhizobium sp. ISRA463]WGS28690.1 hypothetical protein MTX19_06435 [Bradyrhizobium sp. ISRA464]